MGRPVTLFTGQWGDLTFEEMCQKAQDFGYDGLELACWGPADHLHFDVVRALKEPDYCKRHWEILERHGLNCFAISAHLVGQAVCDLIDERSQCILPADIWGDGEPEGVRERAAERMKDTVRACRKFMDARPGSCEPIEGFTPVVNGFTGSSIWHAVYNFPPAGPEFYQAGYEDFARRWLPILDVCEEVDVNFALEVHPTEIAFDTASAERALEAVNWHRRFGFNDDPSHLAYQHVDYVGFIRRLGDHIFHVHMKDVRWGHGDGTVGVFGGHTAFGDSRRYWEFASVGRGDVKFTEIIRALNGAQYRGPLSVEWEDVGMDRDFGARESCEVVRKLDFAPSNVAFDAAFAADKAEVEAT